MQQHDPAQFTLSLFVSSTEKRAEVFVTHAVLQDIDRVILMGTDANATQLRLKWWYDKITQSYDGQATAGHPILNVFPDMCPENGLTKFHEYIEIAQDIIFAKEGDDARVIAALKRQQDIRTALECDVLEIEDMVCDTAPLACARMLLDVPRSLSRGAEPIVPPTTWQEISCVRDHVTQARAAIEAQRQAWRQDQPPKQSASVCLGYALSEMRLKTVEKANYDLQDGRLLHLPPFAMLRLFVRSFFNHY